MTYLRVHQIRVRSILQFLLLSIRASFKINRCGALACQIKETAIHQQIVSPKALNDRVRRNEGKEDVIFPILIDGYRVKS